MNRSVSKVRLVLDPNDLWKRRIIALGLRGWQKAGEMAQSSMKKKNTDHPLIFLCNRIEKPKATSQEALHFSPSNVW